ncbi:MAG: thiamine phosphate synthase [Clostridia bacterium]|nr:thiamine phosphate synthase [Clostridia bacterium]MBQ3328082.1 thiamine phosphate synthase [Clostridia bacterium]
MIDYKDKKYLALYGVTDRWWVKQKLEKAGVPATDDALREGLLADTRAALEGGMTYVQMREKGDPMTEDELLTEALALKALCEEYGVPFVIDDDVELAKKCGADGVHVGQSDMACVEARKALGERKVVGVSAQTVEQAVQAEKDGADYLGVGAVFPTGSKDDADDVSHDTVKAICEAVSIPVIAIGGISKDNVGQLAGLGLDGIAVISAIYAADDLKAATEDLKARTVEALNL